MKAGLFILGGLGAVAAAVATIPDDIANRSPTHIIKFKRKPTNVTSTFARDFIATKHREYILAAMLNKQSKAKKSKREQEEDEDEGGDAEDEIEAQDFDDEEDDEAVYAASIERQFALDAIDIGPDFIALAGVFPDKDFIDLLHVEEDIDYVEVNQMYKATLIPPYHDQVHRDELKFLQQENLTKRNLKLEKSPNWGLSRINQRLLSDFDSYEYDETAGQGVDVFVLDTGVYTGHSDFEGRAVTVANLVEQEDDNDMGGHGTHVASKIAGKVHGVAKAANIRSVKILNQHGDGSTSVLIKGISEIIKNHTAGKTVVNLSLSGPRSRIIDEALSKLVRDYNIPVFASAGNAENDACYFSPSANADVFAVGATDSKDQVASYSNTGSCVDIYAPGSDIKSAWIGSADSTMNLDGTSMASPHVAGIAANLMSKGSFRSAAEIYNALTLAATNGVLTFEDSDNTNNHNLLAYNTR